MIAELFVLNPDTLLVEINKPWITTIKEFRKLVVRDKGSKGDIDGRKKLRATKEFTFIYHFVSYKSEFENYSETERAEQSRINAELEDSFDYRKDEDLVLAIKKYKDLQDSPALRLLTEAKEGLHLSNKVIRNIRKALETQLEATDFDQINSEIVVDEDATEEEKANQKKAQYKKLIDDPITKITKTLKGILDLTNSIEPTLKNIAALEDKVKKELGDKVLLRGDKMKGDREDLPPAVASESTPKSIFEDI